MHLAEVPGLAVPTSTSKEPMPTDGIAVYVTSKALLFGEEKKQLIAIDDQKTLGVGGFGASYKTGDGTPLGPLADAVTELRKAKELAEWVPAALVVDAKTPFRAVAELIGTVQHARFERMFVVVRSDGKLSAITLSTGVRPPPPLPDAPKITPGGQVPKGANVTLGIAITERGLMVRAFGRPVGPGCSLTSSDLDASGSLAPTVPIGQDGHDFDTLKSCLRTLRELAEGTHDDRVSVSASPATEWQTVVHVLDTARDDAKGRLFPEASMTLVH